MALDYTTANTGVFYRLGRLAKAVNAHQAMPATTLPAELLSVVDPYEAANLTTLVLNAYADFASFQAAQTSLRQRVAAYANPTLQDYATVLSQIGLLASGLGSDFWQHLWLQMVADSKTVNRSTATVPATATASGANVGDASVLLTKLLDGVSSPLRNGPAVRAYGMAGAASELVVPSEAMTFEVTGDRFRGGRAGAERVSWRGGQNYAAWDYRAEGSGQGPDLTVSTNGLLSDGEMEDWSANVPTSWTVALGTAGTHVLRDQSAGNFFRGLSAARLAGDGVLAEVKLSQPVASLVEPLRCYCLSLRLKASAAVAAGDFTAGLAGTGWSSATIAVAHGSLPTAWTLYSLFFLTPVTVPDDLMAFLSWAGTPTSAKSLWLDNVALTEVVYHGGVGAVVVPGATDLSLGDKWTAAVSNDQAGVFQEFARRQWGVQLPSSGSPSISDSLAV